MRIRELACALALAATTMTACTENPDPRKPTLGKMQTQGIGAWIVVTARTGFAVQGELISATPQYIHVLRLGEPTAPLVFVPTADVAHAEVYTYESEGGLGAFGLLGTLSTISHGLFLIFTAPIWIISTSIAISVEESHVEIEYPEEPLSEISKWARFPQGIPAGLDEEALLVPRASRRPRMPPPAAFPQPAAPGETPAAPVIVPPPVPPEPTGTNPAALFQQAKTAAAANDCAKVLELSGTVQLADQPFWDAVFSKDASIRRCLGL